jgi:hypothetical protein
MTKSGAMLSPARHTSSSVRTGGTALSSVLVSAARENSVAALKSNQSFHTFDNAKTYFSHAVSKR